MLKVGEIIQTVKGIVETKIDIVKSEVQDEFIGMMSRFILLTLIGSMSFIVLLFLSLSLAFYLSQFTKLPFMGFFLVGLIYLLIVIVLILTRDSTRFHGKIQEALRGFIFSKFKKNRNDDE